MKLSKYYTISICILICSVNIAMAYDVVCKNKIEKQDLTEETAKQCVQESIIGTVNAEEIFKFLETHDEGIHLKGDINKCTTLQKGDSFFDKDNFVAGMKNAKVSGNCKFDNGNNTFKCWIKDGPKGCVIPKNGNGKVTTNVFLKIGKSSGKLVTFFPSN